jgi:hypothetical protein
MFDPAATVGIPILVDDGADSDEASCKRIGTPEVDLNDLPERQGWVGSESRPTGHRIDADDLVSRVMTQLPWLTPRPVYLDRVVYSTITLMSVLIIYDGWQHLRLLDVVGVIVGPVVAMFLAHVFSALVARQVELGRPLERTDYLTTIRSESRFLLLCVPPLVIVSVLFGFGVSLFDAIQVTLWVGVASLGFWGFVAGRRAGYTGWRMVIVVGAGLLIGLVVLTIQVILQPGKVASGGEL